MEQPAVAAKPTPLVVDILNFSHKLNCTTKQWDLYGIDLAVKRFVDAATNSNFELYVYIDASIQTGEAIKKWKDRREKEIFYEYKDVPLAMSTLIGDYLRIHGVVHVYYSRSHDNDDTIAYEAQTKHANILSNDADFLDYEGHNYQLFGDYEIKADKLILIPKKVNPRRVSKPKQFPKEKPTVSVRCPEFAYAVDCGIYKRGVSHGLSKYFPSIYSRLTPLRVELYDMLGIIGPVTEIFPEWDEVGQKVEWVEVERIPSKSREYLTGEIGSIVALESINDARTIKGVERYEVLNYQLALVIGLGEILAATSSRIRLIDACRLLPIMNGFDAWIKEIHEQSDHKEVESVCNNYIVDGHCKFGEKCFAKSGHFVCNCRRELCRYYHKR